MLIGKILISSAYFMRLLYSSVRPFTRGKIKIGINQARLPAIPLYFSAYRSRAIRGRCKGARMVVELYYLARFTFRGVVAYVVEK